MNPTASPTLLVLAAGMGSRYGGLKQIDPVGPSGETILDYSIYDALRAGFGKVVFVLRAQIEQAFRETVGARFADRVPVEYVFQELDQLPPGFAVPAGRVKPWGTTHAVLAAAEAIHEPFAVLNADDFYGRHGYQELAHHLTSGTSDSAMVGFTLRNTLSDFGAVARGLCQVSSDGFLEDVVELTHIEREGTSARNTDPSGRVTALSGDEIVSMNLWGFQPTVFAALREEFRRFLERSGSDQTARSGSDQTAANSAECYLPNAVNALMHSGQTRVRVLPTQDTWFGVTWREDRPHVVEGIASLIRHGDYPESLWP